MVSLKPTFAFFIFSICLAFYNCIPLAEEDYRSVITKNSESVDSNKSILQSKDKLRKDGDGDGDDGVGEIEQVGEQVSQIINGVLSGNFGQLFAGSTSFIQDTDTQTGVGTILESLNKPLNTILVSGVQSGQKYYNITDPPTIILVPTTAAPPPPPPPPQQQLQQQNTQLGSSNFANNPQSYYLEPINNQPVRVAVPLTAAPIRNIPRFTTQKVIDDEDDDNEDGDSKVRKSFVKKLLKLCNFIC